MSTTINVTVDDGGLPAKNRQQTAANRQAFVQGVASQQTAQKGADQRTADRRAAGLDPTTGRPTGSSSRLPRVTQEPAANRRGGNEFFLLRPDGPVVIEPGQFARIDLTHKGLVSSVRALNIDPETQQPQIINLPSYDATAGPSGSPALVSYPRVNETGTNAGLHIFQASFPEAETNTRFSGGVKDFTLQKYVYFTLLPIYNDDLSVYSYVSIGDWGFIRCNFQYRRTGDGMLQEFTVSVRQNPTAQTYTPIDYVAPYPPSGSIAFEPYQWHHVAVCKKDRVIRVFLNGQMVGSSAVNFDTVELIAANPWLYIEFGNDSFNTSPERYKPVLIHGPRFDTKALYTANFTPPPSL